MILSACAFLTLVPIFCLYPPPPLPLQMKIRSAALGLNRRNIFSHTRNIIVQHKLKFGGVDSAEILLASIGIPVERPHNGLYISCKDVICKMLGLGGEGIKFCICGIRTGCDANVGVGWGEGVKFCISSVYTLRARRAPSI